MEHTEWGFTLNDRVVGYITADCCVCAWRRGSELYPGARMVMVFHPAETQRFDASGCLKLENEERKRMMHEEKLKAENN